MQSQLVAMLILTSSTQIRGDERPQPEPPPVRPVTVIRFRAAAGGEAHELTLEMPTQAGEDDDQPPARPVIFDLNNAMLERKNFDRWLFPHDESQYARDEHLKDILDAKIDLVATANKLTGPQRAKLRLAGRGDIKRFFDEVQKRRDDFEIERREFNAGVAALRRLDTLLPSYREGPFGTGSLFAKTLHKINNDRTVGR
jgi:hypothetical protein